MLTTETDSGMGSPSAPPRSSDLNLIDRALAEDVGDGDATTEATVAADARGRATITQKAPGVISGLDVAEAVFLRLDADAVIERLGPEGVWRESGPVLRVEGSARALLTAERTALNFLGRLSGVATKTARVVRAVGPGGAKILDTRKTTPGMRLLEKAAVAHGGGVNHRIGLFDFILIKENHSALAGGVGEAVRRAREARPELPLAVEVRDGAEISEALAAGAERLLLDNMTPDEVRAAVAQVDGRALLEVSGGVDEETVLVYATISGVDFVSIGALTHSAPVLDLSLILETVQ
jgi:nicotinate-nucleotide pyrophosphorylase (carboxylating)